MASGGFLRIYSKLAISQVRRFAISLLRRVIELSMAWDFFCWAHQSDVCQVEYSALQFMLSAELLVSYPWAANVDDMKCL